MHDFDSALAKANEWVHQMGEELGIADAHRAHGALRAGLHALRDRLGVDEASQLGAQLPLVIRGLYYEGWNPSGKPLRLRSSDDFLELVALRSPPRLGLDPGAISAALFRVLTRRLSPGETDAVRHALPKPLSKLWADAAGAV